MTEPRIVDVVVLGGGVAGLAVAGLLRQAGVGDVCVLEPLALYASQASARNAAMFLPVERDAVTTRLVLRQAELLDALFAGSDEEWLSRTGALLVSSDASKVGALHSAVTGHGFTCEVVDRESIVARVPALKDGDARFGISVSASGVLNTHGMITLLIERARGLGVLLRNDVGSTRVECVAGQVVGVILADGSRIATRAVVIAGGAWSSEIGTACGASLPLTPLKRHLHWLRGDEAEDLKWPVVWSLDDEVYFRPESGGILASPCDERPTHASVDTIEEADAKDALATKLMRIAPSLLERGVRRSWACLRTYAPDRLPVLGADPRVHGLHWLAGLGGQGMSVCLSAAEVTVAAFTNTPHPLRDACAPDRLIATMEQR
ncbi:MAG: FAD-binding oxidoreductase [Sandaracinaceae bacterium]|nr:FAD-binding oxidoreductase [Sandaracinaceae bacterium]